MLDMIRQIFGFIFAVSLQYVLLGCELGTKRVRYLVLAWTAALLTVCAGILFTRGYVSFMRLYPLLVNVPVLIGFIILSKRSFFKVLFVELTVIAIVVSITTAGLVVSYFFEGSNTVVNVVSYALYIPAWIAVYRHMRPTFLSMLDSTVKGWPGFCMIPLCYCLLVYSISQYDLQSIVIERVIRNVILFFVMGFSAYYMILKLFQQTRRQISMQQEENLLRLQIAEAKVHFESLKEVNESISICKHDMRHHLNLIHSYLADDNKDAARKYIAGIQDTIEAATGDQYCSNYTVNLILSSYIGIAKESLIKVTCNLQLPASDRISDMDLCVIFANAIENATHACLNLTDPQERWIRIDTKAVGQQIRIQIHNSFSGKAEFAGGIPVNREEGHGMGVKSIIAVVEKYGGLCDFSVQDNVFKVSIIL